MPLAGTPVMVSVSAMAVALPPIVRFTFPMIVPSVNPDLMKMLGDVLVTVTDPVDPDTLIPAPDAIDVTPVLEHETAPEVGEHDTPEVPVTDDTAFVPVHVTAPVVGEQLTVPAPVTLDTPDVPLKLHVTFPVVGVHTTPPSPTMLSAPEFRR